jgi:UDP-N-acetylmuramate dehydrogenase
VGYVILDVTLRLRHSWDSVPIRYAELARRLGVEQGERAPIDRVRETVLSLRRGKGMVLDDADPDTWSVGSFFVNPVVDAAAVPAGCPQWAVDGRIELSAAWLIQHAGFGRGFGLDQPPGTVSLSTKHCLALTNRSGARTTELLRLARTVRDGVESRFGIGLLPEPRLAGMEFWPGSAS